MFFNLMKFGIARPVTNLCLLLTVILTAFLLSGTTSNSPGISNLNAVKIVLNSTREAVTFDAPATTRLAPETTLVRPPLRSSTRVSISSAPKPTTISNTLVAPSTVKTPSSSAVTKTATTNTVPRLVLVRPTSTQATDGAADGAAQAAGVSRRSAQVTARALEETSEGTIVLVSYFGLCTRNRTSPLTCTKARTNSKNFDPSMLEILRLGASIQGAISPYPPIVALTVQGVVILLSLFAACRPGVTNLASKLGQMLAVLAFSAFGLSFITAILFQSASSMVYGTLSTHPTIVPYKGTNGIALAWTAVLFAGLGMGGVVMMLITGKAYNNHQGHTWQRDYELPGGMFGCRGQPKRASHDVEVPPMVIQHSVGGHRTGVPHHDTRELYPRDNYI